MKNPMRICAIIICALIPIMIVATMLSSLNNRDNIQTDPSTEPYITTSYSAEELYQQAINQIALHRNLTLVIHTKICTTVNEESFLETIDQTVTYNNLGTSSMTAFVEETRKLGEYNIEYSEAYHNDLMFCSVGDGKFSSSMSPAIFKKRYAPSVLLDTTCYNSSDVIYADGVYMLTFQQPVAIENWCAVEGASLVDASGTAVLDENNNLLENTYSVTYKNSDAEVTKSVQVLIKEASSIPLPQTKNYIPIDNPDAPLMLERACGYLIQASTISSQTKETIICEAFGDNRVLETSVQMHDDPDNFMAELILDTLLINNSQGGDEVRQNKTLAYKDGKYSSSANGQPSASATTVTPEQMRNTCQNVLLGTVLMPKYIQNSTAVVQKESIRYEYTVSDELAKTLCQNACETLYNDPNLLFNLSSDNNTNELTAYLEISKTTGLPTASGILYSGTFIIDEHPYLMKNETNQTYDISN